jgi:hypothetical protein
VCCLQHTATTIHLINVHLSLNHYLTFTLFYFCHRLTFTSTSGPLPCPFYVAEVSWVHPDHITLHYWGTTGLILTSAVFKPCWHLVNTDDIVLNSDPLDQSGTGLQFVPFTGDVDLSDLSTVLVVARHIEFTKAGKLRFRSLRALTPVHDQLFRFER